MNLNSHIFLGNAPWYRDGFYGVRAGSRWPHFQEKGSRYLPFPFFLAYASALLKREGFSVTFVDGVAERLSPEVFLQKVYDASPDLVLLEVSTISINTDLDYAEKIKQRLGARCLVAFAGLHTEMNEPTFLERHPQVDLVLVGEYEYTLRDLAAAIEEKRSFQSIEGIVYTNSDGEIIKTPPRALIHNLDELPWPDRESVPIYDYCDTPWDIPMPSVQMWASRGCPFQCVFCAWPQIMYGGHRYRVRSPQDVAAEMEYLVKEMGFKSVYFDDDTFNIGKPRILSLCREIKKRQLHHTPWAVMARADTMDEEMLHALKDAGLVALKYGVESADQSIVERSGKGLDLNKVKKIIELTKSLGIKVHLTYTFGLPGETRETVDSTIALALEHDPDSLQFSIITPWPGSILFDELEKKGHILSKNWEEYDGSHKAVIRTDALSREELEHSLQKAYATWERHVALRTMKKQPSNMLKNSLRHPISAVRKVTSLLKSKLSH